jgi:D-sedoheptulose 7-phosphate isomerase
VSERFSESLSELKSEQVSERFSEYACPFEAGCGKERVMEFEIFERYPNLEKCRESIEKSIDLIEDSYRKGGKLLLCGNGGSASDCDHISGELLKGFKSKRALKENDVALLGESLASKLQGSLPTIPLPVFHGLGTAFSNDCEPEFVYAQLVWGLGNRGDTLVGLSTSGNSANVLRAVEVANKKGLTTIGLTGESGGQLKELCSLTVAAPSSETFVIQEYHLPIYHYICIEIEKRFF